MDRKTGPYLLLLVAAVAVVAILWIWKGTPTIPEAALEVAIQPIPLTGGAESSDAELSGLAWWNDTLVLLPQFPERFDNNVFTISREAIEAFLDSGSTDAIEVGRVPIETPTLESDSYDGFEAIAFDRGQVFVSVEARREDTDVVGWLMRGRVVGDLERIVIEPDSRAPLEAQNDLENTGYEAILVHGDQLLVIYETNGQVNGTPQALVFDRDLSPQGTMSFADLEYRVTDASSVDSDGHFWVSNYHWPLSPWNSGQCELTERFGEGESHARCQTVERLVELEVGREGVVPTSHAPVQLELVDDEHARNWEGLVRLGDRGFLVVTDEHPTTILAFLPLE